MGDIFAFLYYGAARAELALGIPDNAKCSALAGLSNTLEDIPYPRQLLLACIGLAEIKMGYFDRGKQLLLIAGDLRFVEGDFLRFGLATAHGHYIIAALNHDQKPSHDEIRELSCKISSLALSVPGLAQAEELNAKIKSLLKTHPLPKDSLALVVEDLIRLFPYGIDPWIWRNSLVSSE